MKLSANIITLNEEKNISRCLESVKELVDEIILVDSDSEDRTVDIAKKFGAKVYIRKFDNYANQKNFAVQKSKGEWILSLDADEVISKELADEIRVYLKKRNDLADAYTIPRKNIILGKYIRFSRWQPELDRHVWLWKKAKGKWVGDVHEEVEIAGKVEKLNFFKIHYQYKNVFEFMEMMNNYSELEAKARASKNVKLSLYKLLLDPIYNFLVRYIYRLGFLDGWRGFVLSYLMGIYHFELWIKVWNLNNK